MAAALEHAGLRQYLHRLRHCQLGRGRPAREQQLLHEQHSLLLATHRQRRRGCQRIHPGFAQRLGGHHALILRRAPDRRFALKGCAAGAALGNGPRQAPTIERVASSSPFQPGRVGTFRRNVRVWVGADVSAKRPYHAHALDIELDAALGAWRSRLQPPQRATIIQL